MSNENVRQRTVVSRRTALHFLALVSVSFACVHLGCAPAPPELDFDPVTAIVSAEQREDGEDLRRMLGYAYMRAGMLRMAENELASYVRENPSEAPAWLFLGQVRHGLGRRKASRLALERYGALRPGLVSRLGPPDFANPGAEWREVFGNETELLLHPHRPQQRARLSALMSRGGVPWDPGQGWDPAVSDATTWGAAAAVLPDFPPPPDGR